MNAARWYVDNPRWRHYPIYGAGRQYYDTQCSRRLSEA
jgi:hypothetical protein